MSQLEKKKKAPKFSKSLHDCAELLIESLEDHKSLGSNEVRFLEVPSLDLAYKSEVIQTLNSLNPPKKEKKEKKRKYQVRGGIDKGGISKTLSSEKNKLLNCNVVLRRRNGEEIRILNKLGDSTIERETQRGSVG